jgi:hypothetical protein
MNKIRTSTIPSATVGFFILLYEGPIGGLSIRRVARRESFNKTQREWNKEEKKWPDVAWQRR